MKYSYNWLKELSGTKKTPQQLAELLTMRAFEVKGIEKIKNDTVLDIDVLANRAHDALSHIGMTREIVALEGRKIKIEAKPRLKTSTKNLKIEIKDKKLCSRYIGAIMTDIKVKESPKWMRERLESLGQRPINNIVDATNFVMLETGQPLHAFDLNKIKCMKITNPKSQITNKFQNSNSKIPNIEIIVRRAENGERIKLLDETEKVLTSEDLVIADGEKVLAIAGIKGGADAEINETTKTIVLEAANFNSTAIRKSRMRLGLQTDSSLRFEKEIDPNLAGAAMAKLIEIIEMAGGKTEGIVDVYPKKVKPWKIKLDLEYVNKLLGENIPAKTIIRILSSLDIKTQFGSSTSNWKLSFQIPTFRLDLRTQEDLIEEIGRIYGYEKIRPLVPVAPIKAAPVNEQRIFERIIRRILVGSGFSEVYNYSFYSTYDAGLAQLGTIKHLELENPMNSNQQLMRVSLIPNILKNVRENLKYYREFQIFEIGRVYWPDKEVLPEEKRMLVGVIVLETKEKREEIKRAKSFYETKGCADVLLKRIGIADYYYNTFDATPSDTPVSLWHQGRSAEIKIEEEGKSIGFIGEINPMVLVNFDIHERVAMFEFDLENLQKISELEREYAPIKKYPTVMRDISMIARGNLLVDDILQAIQKAGGDLVVDVDLFDIFDFADGSSSYAFHIIFGADNRTLENREVDELMKKIISSLEKDLRMKVRK